MIFITHDLRVASQICDEIAVMHRGQIVERGPPSQIFLNPKSAYTRELVAAIPGERPRGARATRRGIRVTSGGTQPRTRRVMTKLDSDSRYSRRNALRLMGRRGCRPRCPRPAGYARLRSEGPRQTERSHRRRAWTRADRLQSADGRTLRSMMVCISRFSTRSSASTQRA